MTLQSSEKVSLATVSKTRRKVTTKDARLQATQARLRWANSARAAKLAKLELAKAELEDLLRQIEEKRDMFDSFSGTALWDAVGLDRKDSRFIDGLSSDFERLMSSSKTSTGIDGWPSCVAQSEVHGGNILGVVLETEEENAD